MQKNQFRPKPKSSPLRKRLLPALATVAVAATSGCYIGVEPYEEFLDAGAQVDGGSEPDPSDGGGPIVDAGISPAPEPNPEPGEEPEDAGTSSTEDG